MEPSLDDAADMEPPEPYDSLEELSGKEIATKISNMGHVDRKEMLSDERFLFHHWPAAEEAIDETPSLRSEYGLDGRQIGTDSGTKICLNHEGPSPIKQESYRGKEQRTVGQKHSRKDKKNAGVSTQVNTGDTPMIPISGSGGINAGTGTDDTQEAYAKQTETSGSQKMNVCLADRDACSTSKESFYYAAQSQYKNVWNKYPGGVSYSNKEEYMDSLFKPDNTHTADTHGDTHQTTTDSNTTETTDQTTSTDQTQSSDQTEQSNTNAEQPSTEQQNNDSTATAEDATNATDTTQTDLGGWEHQGPPTEDTDDTEQTEQWELGEGNTDRTDNSDNNSSDFGKSY